MIHGLTTEEEMRAAAREIVGSSAPSAARKRPNNSPPHSHSRRLRKSKRPHFQATFNAHFFQGFLLFLAAIMRHTCALRTYVITPTKPYTCTTKPKDDTVSIDTVEIYFGILGKKTLSIILSTSREIDIFCTHARKRRVPNPTYAIQV